MKILYDIIANPSKEDEMMQTAEVEKFNSEVKQAVTILIKETQGWLTT